MTRYPLYRRLGGTQGRSGRVRKISPPPEFDPRTVQSVTSCYSGFITRCFIYFRHLYTCRGVSFTSLSCREGAVEAVTGVPVTMGRQVSLAFSLRYWKKRKFRPMQWMSDLKMKESRGDVCIESYGASKDSRDISRLTVPVWAGLTLPMLSRFFSPSLLKSRLIFRIATQLWWRYRVKVDVLCYITMYLILCSL